MLLNPHSLIPIPANVHCYPIGRDLNADVHR